MTVGMKKLPTWSLIVIGVLAGQVASAQVISNGSFETGDFSGWQTTMGINPGSPAVLMGGSQVINGQTTNLLNPFAGSFEAFIQSTGGASVGQSVSATTALPALQTFLGVPANGLPDSSAVGGIPINGVGIKQSFTTTAAETKVSFAYAYQSREVAGSGLDETGYVLNGVFHVLVDSDTAGLMTYNPNNGIFLSFLPYQTETITVPAGVNTLAFASYNTLGTLSTTGLLIDNVMIIPTFSTVPGLTPNQNAVATYIDNNDGAIGGSLPGLITALGNATTAAQLGDALDQLSPQSLQVFRRIAFDNATFNTLDVTNHLANLRDGLTGFDGSQLTVSDPSLTSGASRIKSRLQDPKDMRNAADAKDMKEMQPAAQIPADRWSTFIVGDVVLADLSHDQDMAHQDYTTGSVMLGTDYRLDDHFTVGAFLAYSHTDADLDHIGSSATVDSYSPGVYASYVDGGWYGNALFAYAFNSYTEDRNIQIGNLVGTNQSAPQGNQYTGSLTGGYEFKSGDFKYGPIASVQYVNLGINSFSEDGPTALNVQSESDESFRTQLGVEARYAVRVGSMYLVPHISATWQHEFLDDNNGITSQFNNVGPGTFTVQTTPLDRDSAVIDVGLNADVTSNVTLFTDYQTEAGQSDFFAQSVAAGVKIGF